MTFLVGVALASSVYFVWSAIPWMALPWQRARFKSERVEGQRLRRLAKDHAAQQRPRRTDVTPRSRRYLPR